MIGAAVGAGLSALGTLYGGWKASQAMKKVQGNVERQKADNEAWFNRKYNEDATQRADAQRILNKTEEAIKSRNRQAAASAAVMGGTDESVAATKGANAEAMAEAASQIAVSAEGRKDAIEQSYQQKREGYDAQLNNLEAQRANGVASATMAAGKLGGEIAGMF